MKLSNRDRFEHISLWIGAVLVGGITVLYAKLISMAQSSFFYYFASYPYWVTFATPFLFLAAAGIVRRFGPEAKGSGIPQVLVTVNICRDNERRESAWHSPLVSLRTAVVKVLSSAVGILGGASVGREGPSIQIAASIFAGMGRLTRKHSPRIQLPLFLIAGAAAGVAAAFNTPLAGITFVMEEFLDGAFGVFKQSMMIAVIIAGITAQAVSGDYLFFGHPAVSEPNFQVVYQSVLIGVVGGGVGGLFSWIIANPNLKWFGHRGDKKDFRPWMANALICGAVCAVLAFFTQGSTAGSGYEVTANSLNASAIGEGSLFFPIFKMITTILSYFSGMAGGIFSPSLSIGAGIGVSLAKVLHFSNFKACALMGMVAFFSGVVQAPLTAVVIVMEMTDKHVLIIPFMIAAWTGHGIGKLMMPVPLYHYLAKRDETRYSEARRTS